MRSVFLLQLKIVGVSAALFGSSAAPVWLLAGTPSRSHSARVAAGSSVSVLHGAPLRRRPAARPVVTAPARLVALPLAPAVSPQTPARPRPVRELKPAHRPTPAPIQRASIPSATPPQPKPPPTSSTPPPPPTPPAPVLGSSVQTAPVVFQAAPSASAETHQKHQGGQAQAGKNAAQKTKQPSAKDQQKGKSKNAGTETNNKTSKTKQPDTGKVAAKDTGKSKNKGTDSGKAAGSDGAAGSQSSTADQNKGDAGKSNHQSKQDGNTDKSGGDTKNGNADKKGNGANDGHGKKGSSGK